MLVGYNKKAGVGPGLVFRLKPAATTHRPYGTTTTRVLAVLEPMSGLYIPATVAGSAA